MATRRDLLKAATAASTLPLVAKLSPVWSWDFRQIPAVFDERSGSSVAFAREIQALGSSVYATSGDITDLWYDTLHYRWQSDSGPIAGLTAHGALFCLERLSWTYGLRLTHRAEHRERRDGTVEHTATGHPFSSADSEALNGAGWRWPQALAHLILRNPSAAAKPIPNIYVGPALSPSAEHTYGETEPLYSWVLAPVGRA